MPPPFLLLPECFSPELMKHEGWHIRETPQQDLSRSWGKPVKDERLFLCAQKPSFFLLLLFLTWICFQTELWDPGRLSNLLHLWGNLWGMKSPSSKFPLFYFKWKSKNKFGFQSGFDWSDLQSGLIVTMWLHWESHKMVKWPLERSWIIHF